MVFSTKDVAVIAGLGILVFLITRAGRDLAGALGNLQFPDFNFPDINFPSINFPSNPISVTFPNIPENDRSILEEIQRLGGLSELNQQQIVDLLSGLTPLGTPENPADDPVSPTPIDVVLNDPTLSDEQRTNIVRILNPDIGVDDPNNDPNRFQPTFGRGFTGREEDRPIELGDRPVNLDQLVNRQDNFIPLPAIGETLNDLTQRLDITASQAADLRFRDEETDFDFGTNTGSGIGSIFARPDINTEFDIGNVSNPDFGGLSASEIVNRLTGGNINNF